jgi:hypothetical protein
MQKDNRINFDGQTLAKVLQGTSYTVGDSVNSPSPTGFSSGVSPTTIFDAQRPSVGGGVYAGFSDAPGVLVDDLHVDLQPGDTVTVSAIALGVATVSVNGETVALVPATAFAGVLLYWS